MPTLGDAFEDYMAANPNRSKRTDELYRYEAKRLSRRLALPPPRCYRPPGCGGPLQPHYRGSRLVACQPRDVPVALRSTAGPASISRAYAIRSIYGSPAAASFIAKCGARISTPAEVLPCWRAGIEAEVNNPAIRDALWFGLYTGMRRDEVLTLRWERVDMAALTFRVEETKTGRSPGASCYPAAERYPETPLSRKR